MLRLDGVDPVMPLIFPYDLYVQAYTFSTACGFM